MKLTFILRYLLFGLAFGIIDVAAALTAITQSNIKTAVNLWVSDEGSAMIEYGHIKTWDTSAVTDMNRLFRMMTLFNDDISGWDVSNVTNMDNMFFGASAFNINIGAWNVSSVTVMTMMFRKASAFDQDISAWEVSSVTIMKEMFKETSAFNQNISGWNVASISNMDDMFDRAYAFDQDRYCTWELFDNTSCNTCSADCSVVTPSTNLGEGGAQGDPHFKTWQGDRFDFHGVCDLILLQITEFMSGLGLDVHIRTHMRRDMSYISSAVLRIGTDVLEVESKGVYYLNGVLGADLPIAFGGFAFLYTQPSDKQSVFEVHLGGRERIKVKTYKDFVSVLFEQSQQAQFGESVGLMGAFGTGHMIARDGKTIMTDANAFGQEWQVLDSEPKLFQSVRFPQYPIECSMPTPEQTTHIRRRLADSSVDELAAEKACEHWGEGKGDCVFDVLTTGDLEMAMVGAY